jgi:hypothetical protein
MIKFIIENIESSHICSKYIDDLINSKNPKKILDGLLLTGYWANTYPIRYFHTRVLDVIFIFSKNVDLREVFTSEESVSKFLKGIFLLVKAFPKANEDILQFLNTIKNNINYLINDHYLNSKAKVMLDRALYFIENIIINSDFMNENTLYIKI